MVRLRIVYPEEVEALSRLFFLTENRPLTESDYSINDGYIDLFSDRLTELLHRFQIETIWAPIWLSGLANGLFSPDEDKAAELAEINSVEIPWILNYGSIVWIDRNYYQLALSLPKLDQWIYLPNPNLKRLITGGIRENSQNNFYRVPPGFTAEMLETYLQGWSYFILPLTITLEELHSSVLENFKRTKSKRVPGGRKIIPLNDRVALKLDSFDELESLLTGNSTGVNNGSTLRFPDNLHLSDDDALIWKFPVAVGKEDLSLELSYYRETEQVDPDYWQYRENRILELDPATRDFFVVKHLAKPS